MTLSAAAVALPLATPSASENRPWLQFGVAVEQSIPPGRRPTLTGAHPPTKGLTTQAVGGTMPRKAPGWRRTRNWSSWLKLRPNAGRARRSADPTLGPTEPEFGLPFSVAGAFGVGRGKGATCVVSIEQGYVEAH